MTLTKCVFPCWETPLKCYIRNSEYQNKKLGHNGSDEKTVCITDKNTNNEQWYILPINKGVVPNLNNNEDDVEIYCRIATSLDNNACRLVLNNESELTKRLYTCKGDKVEGDPDIWILRKSLNNEFYYLKASDCSDLYLGCDDNTWLTSTSDIVDENKASYQWKVEVLTGELCYIKSKYLKKFVSCDNSGKLTMNQTYSATEVWRFIEVGDIHNSVLIASWTPYKGNVKYIISKPNGAVETSEEYSSSWARWVLIKTKCGTGIFVRSLMHNEKYLSIESNGRFYTTGFNSVESVWQTGPAHENKFYISSSCSEYDIRVGCDASSGAIIASNKRDNSTSWTVVADVDSNTIYIQHIETKKWLGVTSNEKGDECPEPCLLKDKLHNTEWFLGLASDNSLVIVSCHHSKWRLAYSGLFYMIDSDHEHAKWHLEPITPVADKGHNNIIPIVIAATVSAMAAPVLFTAVVSGIGFTSVGVVGGSYAAGMMSTAAIANGGGIAAGSTVALLQSVGAYGLGVFGTSVAVGSGALVGAGGTTLLMSGMSQQHDQTNESVTSTNDEGTVIPQRIQNRPICSYELW